MWFISGAIAAFTISKVNWNWYSVGDVFFAVGSLVAGGVLLCCVYCTNLWFIYAFYIIYGMMYQTMLTIAEWVRSVHILVSWKLWCATTVTIINNVGYWSDAYACMYGGGSSKQLFISIFLSTILTYNTMYTSSAFDWIYSNI